MIWACIGIDYKSKLYFIDKTLKESNYIQMLKEVKVFEECDTKYQKWQYVFQQDGATCHTTAGSISYISKKAKTIYGWPSNSPDLSPIENLWAIMKDKLEDETIHPKNREDLKKLLLKIYDEIEYETINSLINSFKYRLKMCLDVGGQTIAHFLRKHFHEIPPQYQVPPDKRPQIITPEINLEIYKLNVRFPHRWKKNI